MEGSDQGGSEAPMGPFGLAMSAGGPPIVPAATVVLLRDSPGGGIETLMLRRSSKLAFAGGMWVWPGGRIDPEDHDPDAPDDLEAAARRAAVREAREEAGLELDPTSLVWFSHWTPPAVVHKRFATYFFVAAAPDGAADVVVDGGEILEHTWVSPANALARRNAQEIEVVPPTWITLEDLMAFSSTAEALEQLAARPPEIFETRFASVEGGGVALYRGDAAYETGEVDTAGPRKRLWMLPDGWRYERSP